MNRIPTEGLKRQFAQWLRCALRSLNEQNPDRGIETCQQHRRSTAKWRLNEQNPDRGIETHATRGWRFDFAWLE